VLSAEQIRRLRWRCRRGLLENDIVLSRFLDGSERELSAEEVEALDRLLDQTDPDLLDLILRRTEPSGTLDSPAVQRLLARLRAA
jgi:antitoxin CptB